MASSSPYHPRSRAERGKNIRSATTGALESRSARGRLKRERQVERRFALAFLVVVAGTTLYLVLRSPWGITILRHWHIVL
ncbi:MAG: hypothetical protein C7B46_10745 [Sulfobacillus benefaciens]|uniref:Uncharacterized protein n=1 Tax=Sulfobacillus benefaciens TaxID=453960 RepID=A0A2T2XFG2_9FIRM|nr:MAG: hypothetical protein C7B46_10745 [Sulfobacillus benefaciens]